MDPGGVDRRGMAGVTIGRQLAGIREGFGWPICSLSEERFVIDNHGAFAGLEQEINVAGGPLTVTVEAQKRCLDEDGFWLEKIV